MPDPQANLNDGGMIAGALTFLTALFGGGGMFAWARKKESKIAQLERGLQAEIEARREAQGHLEKALEANANELAAIQERERNYRQAMEHRLMTALRETEGRLEKQTSVLFTKIDEQRKSFDSMAQSFYELRGQLRRGENHGTSD